MKNNSNIFDDWKIQDNTKEANIIILLSAIFLFILYFGLVIAILMAWFCSQFCFKFVNKKHKKWKWVVFFISVCVLWIIALIFCSLWLNNCINNATSISAIIPFGIIFALDTNGWELFACFNVFLLIVFFLIFSLFFTIFTKKINILLHKKEQERIKEYNQAYLTNNLTKLKPIPVIEVIGQKIFRLKKINEQVEAENIKKEQERISWKNGVILNDKTLISKNVLTRHTLIVGSTGAGKTNTLLNFVKFFIKNDLKCFFVDMKGDESLIENINHEGKLLWHNECKAYSPVESNQEFEIDFIDYKVVGKCDTRLTFYTKNTLDGTLETLYETRHQTVAKYKDDGCLWDNFFVLNYMTRENSDNYFVWPENPNLPSPTTLNINIEEVFGKPFGDPFILQPNENIKDYFTLVTKNFVDSNLKINYITDIFEKFGETRLLGFKTFRRNYKNLSRQENELLEWVNVIDINISNYIQDIDLLKANYGRAELGFIINTINNEKYYTNVEFNIKDAIDNIDGSIIYVNQSQDNISPIFSNMINSYGKTWNQANVNKYNLLDSLNVYGSSKKTGTLYWNVYNTGNFSSFTSIATANMLLKLKLKISNDMQLKIDVQSFSYGYTAFKGSTDIFDLASDFTREKYNVNTQAIIFPKDSSIDKLVLYRKI